MKDCSFICSKKQPNTFQLVHDSDFVSSNTCDCLSPVPLSACRHRQVYVNPRRDVKLGVRADSASPKVMSLKSMFSLSAHLTSEQCPNTRSLGRLRPEHQPDGQRQNSKPRLGPEEKHQPLSQMWFRLGPGTEKKPSCYQHRMPWHPSPNQRSACLAIERLTGRMQRGLARLHLQHPHAVHVPYLGWRLALLQIAGIARKQSGLSKAACKLETTPPKVLQRTPCQLIGFAAGSQNLHT